MLLNKTLPVPNPFTPCIYGLPKVHKDGSPLPGSIQCFLPTYLLAKYLGGWFKQTIRFQPPLLVKNSIQIISELTQNRSLPGDILVYLIFHTYFMIILPSYFFLFPSNFFIFPSYLVKFLHISFIFLGFTPQCEAKNRKHVNKAKRDMKHILYNTCSENVLYCICFLWRSIRLS